MRHASLLLERFDAQSSFCALPGAASDSEKRAREEAYSAGFAAGQAAAANAAHEHDALLAAAANALATEYNDAPQRIAREAADALKIILERLAPALSEAGFATEAAAAFVRLARETGAPSLEVFAAPDHVEELRAAIGRRIEDGAIGVAADSELTGSAARASWNCGGIEVDLDRTVNECLAALERAANSITSERKK